MRAGRNDLVAVSLNGSILTNGFLLGLFDSGGRWSRLDRFTVFHSRSLYDFIFWWRILLVTLLLWSWTEGLKLLLNSLSTRSLFTSLLFLTSLPCLFNALPHQFLLVFDIIL
jgi:hypothetical protein